MKNIRLITASLFVLVLFSISAFAQATAAQTGKVFVINTYAFSDEKAGIKKFVNASKQIDTEMQPRAKELQTMYDKMQALAKEIQTLRDTLEKNPKAPIDQNTVKSKYDELERMQVDYKRKEEDAKKAVAKRSQDLLDPIRADIYKVMQDFAKQKGYPIILDLAKMDEANIILAIGDDKVDVTDEFVTFYNARPATAASATR